MKLWLNIIWIIRFYTYAQRNPPPTNQIFMALDMRILMEEDCNTTTVKILDLILKDINGISNVQHKMILREQVGSTEPAQLNLTQLSSNLCASPKQNTTDQTAILSLNEWIIQNITDKKGLIIISVVDASTHSQTFTNLTQMYATLVNVQSFTVVADTLGNYVNSINNVIVCNISSCTHKISDLSRATTKTSKETSIETSKETSIETSIETSKETSKETSTHPSGATVSMEKSNNIISTTHSHTHTPQINSDATMTASTPPLNIVLILVITATAIGLIIGVGLFCACKKNKDSAAQTSIKDGSAEKVDLSQQTKSSVISESAALSASADRDITSSLSLSLSEKENKPQGKKSNESGTHHPYNPPKVSGNVKKTQRTRSEEMEKMSEYLQNIYRNKGLSCSTDEKFPSVTPKHSEQILTTLESIDPTDKDVHGDTTTTSSTENDRK